MSLLRPESNTISDENDKVALIVLSCDKYSDIWPIHFDLFFKNWSDCPFPVYLTTNYKTHNDPRVISLPSNSNADWSSCIRTSLSAVDAKRILFIFDDGLLIKKVDNQKIKHIINWAVDKDVSYMKLSPTLLKTEEMGDIAIKRVADGDPYRTSLMGSLWKKDVFLKILKDGESAQQFEILGPARSYEFSDFYYYYEQQFICLHGIRKNQWIRQTVKELKKMGYKIDLSARPKYPRFQRLWHFISKIKLRLRRLGVLI